MRFSKEHRVEIPASRFIELTFDPAFMKRLNIEAMKVQSYEPLAHSVDGAVWTMKNRVTPQDNMPAFIKKLVGGGFNYEESVTHHKGSDTVSAVMAPSVMRDKLRMGYTMRVVPAGDNACRRIMDWEIEVKIFGIGGQIEKFAASEIERSLESSASFLSKQGQPAAV